MPTEADFRRAWQDLRLRRGLFLWGILGCPPTLIIFVVILYLLFRDDIAHKILLVLFLFWGGFFFWSYFRLLFFRCPRCRRLFYFLTPWPLFWPFKRKCFHCRLARNALPDPSELAVELPEFNLKRALKITAIYVAVIGGIFTAVILTSLEFQRRLDAFLKPMFVNVVEAGWSAETLRNYGTDEFDVRTSSDDFAFTVTRWRGYGPIVRYIGVKVFEGRPNSAAAEVWLHFKSGVKSFHVSLVDVEGEWRLQAIQAGHE